MTLVLWVCIYLSGHVLARLLEPRKGHTSGRGSLAPAGLLEPGVFSVSRRAGAPGALGVSGLAGPALLGCSERKSCPRPALVAGSLARLAARMQVGAAFGESAAGKAERGLLDCLEAPSAGCASLQPRKERERSGPGAAALSRRGSAAAAEPEPQESPGSGAGSWLGARLLHQSNISDLQKV